jgi:hypothetical protein
MVERAFASQPVRVGMPYVFIEHPLDQVRKEKIIDPTTASAVQPSGLWLDLLSVRFVKFMK